VSNRVPSVAGRYPQQASFRYRQVPGSTPLVMLHGLGGDHEQLAGLPWKQHIRDHTTLVPDLRGHGSTTADTTRIRPDFDLLAHDVLALAARLGLRRRLVLVGISMGAGTALRIALSQPNRVAGLVCIRPAWAHRAHPANLRIFEQLADHLRADTPALGRASFVESTAYQKVRQRLPDAARSLLAQFDTHDRRRAAAMLTAMPASTPYAARRDLARVRCPTLIASNQHDPFHPVAIAEQWCSGIPQAELVELPPRYREPTEHATALVDIVTRFVAMIDGAA
jgi:pimeloyl-ACP methyl ester carboxylesterase